MISGAGGLMCAWLLGHGGWVWVVSAGAVGALGGGWLFVRRAATSRALQVQ